MNECEIYFLVDEIIFVNIKICFNQCDAIGRVGAEILGLQRTFPLLLASMKMSTFGLSLSLSLYKYYISSNLEHMIYNPHWLAVAL